MKTFKIADIMISTALIFFLIISQCWRDLNHLTRAYFIVGGWQVTSMLVHRFMRCFTRTWGTRVMYHWVTIVSLALLPFGSIWFLFFTAPFMAIFYTCMCIHETTKMSERPLAVLK
ncbi:MAG TPA: hypothetical protein VFZ42_13705 [Chitinophagaceae bacterium]